MGRLKLNTLKRARIRQNWNKHNVYNLFRYRTPSTKGRTFFQQKFRAKQETRRFNGEHLSERKWNDLFRHTLRGVVRMNPYEMAADDGSKAVAGRGSGLDAPWQVIVKNKRRRAELPGGSEQPIPFMQMTFAPLERRLDTAVFRALFASSLRQARNMCVHGKVAVNGIKMPHAGYMLNPGDMFSVDPLLVMRAIGARSTRGYRRLSSEGRDDLDKAIVESQSKPQSTTTLKVDTSTVLASNADAEIDKTPKPSEATPTQDGALIKRPKVLPSNWKTFLPKHPKWKAYETWQPKRFMNLFAFVPRYLEVNHNICHAVYLRHPVARAGGAEVPGPFNNEVMQLAFNWYLRRR